MPRGSKLVCHTLAAEEVGWALCARGAGGCELNCDIGQRFMFEKEGFCYAYC